MIPKLECVQFLGGRSALKVIDLAFESGSECLSLIVSPENARALSLYGSLGFSKEGIPGKIREIRKRIARDDLILTLDLRKRKLRGMDP
jgi:ribosomal protein S18 acetylase RimI-like enzyme